MTYSVDSKDLSGLIRQTFENMQATDVKAVVIPNFEKNFGGVDGLLSKVDIDKNIGVRSTQIDLRRKTFGVNKVEEEPQEPLWKLMWDALQDPTLIFLCAAACFSLIIAIFVEQRPYGWLEGVAILSAVVVVVLVGSINDYQKEMQFRELNSKKDDVQITVLRDAHLTQVSTFDLVVGDVVMLSTGDLIPADGVVLGRNDLEISEKMLTGETCPKKKSPSYILVGNEVISSPTLFAGTFVQAGEGKMLVLAVGVSTYQGSMEQKMKETESGRSILQKKLDSMTDLITSVSMYVSILLVVILSLRMGYGFYMGKCCMEAWKHDVHWSEILGFVITGITIFVVAVPEGVAPTRPLEACCERGPDSCARRSPARRHDCPGLLGQEDAQGQEPRPAPQRLRDHGRGHDHLLGQDGDTHHVAHDGGEAVGGRDDLHGPGRRRGAAAQPAGARRGRRRCQHLLQDVPPGGAGGRGAGLLRQ